MGARIANRAMCERERPCLCLLTFTVAERLRAADVPFLIGPRVRFEGEVGEQGTFFVRDPSGNALEFKTFRDMQRLFQAEG